MLRQRGTSLFACCLVALAALTGLAAADADGFVQQPREAVKSLKVTKGRSFRTGAVFVNGKYLPPPYVVERYGTVIRINGQQVTHPMVPWIDFLKTQEGLKAVREEEPAAPTNAAPAAAEPPPPPPAPEPAKQEQLQDDPLEDLFADEEDQPKKKPAPRAEPPKPKAPPPPPKPAAPKVTYRLDGPFVPNARSAALIKRINAQRTEIDAALRANGFICFGSGYSRVSGDEGALQRLLEKLPETMKGNSSQDAFVSAARANGLGYLPLSLLVDLHRNRIDYIALESRRKQISEDVKWSRILHQ